MSWNSLIKALSLVAPLASVLAIGPTDTAAAGWWRGGGGWHGGYGGWHGGWRGGYWHGGYGGWWGPGAGLGFLGGAIVGSAIASSPYYGYGDGYPYPYYYGTPYSPDQNYPQPYHPYPYYHGYSYGYGPHDGGYYGYPREYQGGNASGANFPP